MTPLTAQTDHFQRYSTLLRHWQPAHLPGLDANPLETVNGLRTSAHLQSGHWRSVNGQEVDFCIGSSVALEAKAKEHLAGLNALTEENTP